MIYIFGMRSCNDLLSKMQLNYLVKPTRANGGSFVLSRLKENTIRETTRNSKLVISDLDDTLTDSPTLELVIKKFLKEDFLDFRQDIWAAKAFFKYMFEREKAVSDVWFEYHDKFGQEFKRYLESQNPNLQFYPGVIDFFNSLPKTTEKIMVTRTMDEIARPFADYLGFDKCRALKRNKLTILKEIKCENSDILIGDSIEDEAVVIALKNNEVHPLTIYVTSSPKKINENFAVIIGRDYRGLNKILNSD